MGRLRLRSRPVIPGIAGRPTPLISYTPDYKHVTYPNSPLKSQGVDISFSLTISTLAASLKTTPFCGREAWNCTASQCSVARPAGLHYVRLSALLTSRVPPTCFLQAGRRPTRFHTPGSFSILPLLPGHQRGSYPRPVRGEPSVQLPAARTGDNFRPRFGLAPFLVSVLASSRSSLSLRPSLSLALAPHLVPHPSAHFISVLSPHLVSHTSSHFISVLSPHLVSHTSSHFISVLLRLTETSQHSYRLESINGRDNLDCYS